MVPYFPGYKSTFYVPKNLSTKRGSTYIRDHISAYTCFFLHETFTRMLGVDLYWTSTYNRENTVCGSLRNDKPVTLLINQVWLDDGILW